MAERYQVRDFKLVNNQCYHFLEVSVDGKYLFQEFINNLKDKKNDVKKVG